MKIITRAEWRAANPTYAPARIKTPTPRLWLHHTVGEWHGPAGMRRTQAFHMETRGYNDVGYSFLVDDNGDVFEGRGARIQGAHTSGDNSRSHAICGLGNMDSRQPTKAMVNSIASLVIFGHSQGWWPSQITGGHRDAPGAQTACPGRYLQAAIPDINALALRPWGTLTTDTPEDPMPLPTDVVDVMPAPGGGFWQLTADGGVEAEHGAPFWGSYPQLGLPARTDFVAITLRHDGGPGYTLWTKQRSDAGYSFPVS